MERDQPSDAVAPRKRSRNTTACIQCRNRKIRCTGQPPNPCPTCQDLEVDCHWPVGDGRSSSARKARFKARYKATQAGAVRPFDNSTDVQDVNEFNDLQSLSTFTQSSHGFPLLTREPAARSESAFDSLDAEQLINALTDRIPVIDPSGPIGTNPYLRSTWSPPAGMSYSADTNTPSIVRVTWWRPHGQTAIAPGLKKITLKVRVLDPDWSPQYRNSTSGSETSLEQDLIDDDGRPIQALMRHLLDVFFTHLACQFPYLDRQGLEASVENGDGSTFLLICIAAISARFSTHPSIALPNLEPHRRGAAFADRAKIMLGSMLSVPSRDTVISFLLLAMVAAGNDSEAEVWTMVGLAVRMSLDMGLHRDQSGESSISEEERRLDRLVFGSVVLYDHSLCFGVGRPTSMHLADVTQVLPTCEDIGHQAASDSPSPTSPFPYAVRQMMLLGRLVVSWNIAKRDDSVEQAARQARTAAVNAYSELPPDLEWGIVNLQKHNAAHQGLMFINLHLWMHTIIAAEYLAEPSSLQNVSAGVASVWRHSVHVIGEILVLSDVVDPFMYMAQPLINVAPFTAGCCYVRGECDVQSELMAEMEQSLADAMRTSTAGSRIALPTDLSARHDGHSDTMLKSIAATKVSQLLQALERMTPYWSGISWIAESLRQRLNGIRDVNLTEIKERIDTHVVLRDPGVLRKWSSNRGRMINSDGSSSIRRGDFADFLSAFLSGTDTEREHGSQA